MDSQETPSPSVVPACRPKRRFLRIALAILAVLLAGGATYRVVQAYRWRIWLVRTCEGADRVVLDLDTFPRRADKPSNIPILPSVTIDDAESVRQLIELIEFKPNWVGWHCLCFGQMRFRFCKGEQELLSLSFHHGEHLRQRVFSGPDMILTARSQAALAKWLDEKGGAALAEAQQEAKRRIAAWRAEQEREYSDATQAASSAPSSAATP